MRIGRGCLVAVNNNARAAGRLFRRAMRDTEPAIKPSKRASHIGRAAIQLHLMASLLDQHNDLGASTRIRQEIHKETVGDIRQLHDLLTGKNIPRLRAEKLDARGIKGELAQKVALGLITRYAHPWLMATPSLLHHDNGKVKANNYDMLVVESMPDHEAQAYKVQVKTACAGLCCDQTRKQRERPLPQRNYNEDVVVISACCDLQRGDHRDVNLINFRAADLLVKEHEGLATTDEISELDGFSDSLILSITMGDERRMGTIPLIDSPLLK